MSRPRVAIVGSGISGLTVAHLLHPDHEITVFEAADRIGGHTHTVDVEEDGRRIPVDTGFIVFNERNYPNFCRLLARIGVDSQLSDMSFSVRDDRDGLEYRGSSLDTLFAQRRNLVRPSFWRMLLDIRRFYREAPTTLAGPDKGDTLGDYLRRHRYSRAFVEQHIVPMAAALWSTGPGPVEEFPLRLFAEFFRNHGMFDLKERPVWRTIRGGSREYVRALTGPFRDRIRLRAPVRSVRRHEGGAEVSTDAAGAERFDRLVLACHADQSLRLLADPSTEEQEVLGTLPYVANRVSLHTDASVLPRNRRARASWNYHLVDPRGGDATVTYHMNRLQRLEARRDYCVTLNRDAAVDPSRVLGRFDYEHPRYTVEGSRARQRLDAVSGVRNTYYCGAYWGYGFHEDGVVSGLRVARHFGRSL